MRYSHGGASGVRRGPHGTVTPMAWCDAVVVGVLAIATGACGGFIGSDAESEGGGSASASSSSSGGETPGTNPTEASAEGTGTTNPVDPTADPTNATSPTETTTGRDETTSGPGSDTESTTGSDTAGESSTTVAESGESSTTGPLVCVQDDEEPNGVFKQATFIGDQDCDDPAQAFDGTIVDGADTDWIEYFGFWDCGGTGTDPDHVVDVVGDNVQVCVTPACQEPVTAFYFCHEGENWTDGESEYGCCSTNRVVMNVNCNNTGNESATGSIRIQPLNNKAVCEDYQLEISVLAQ